MQVSSRAVEIYQNFLTYSYFEQAIIMLWVDFFYNTKYQNIRNQKLMIFAIKGFCLQLSNLNSQIYLNRQMQQSSQSLKSCQQCLTLLSKSQQSFKKVEYLTILARISSNQKYRKTSLLLYSLYCIIGKCDYAQSLQAIQKSQKIDDEQSSMFSVAVCRLVRALLYTFIDKHRDALTLLKQATSLMKSVDSISVEMKNFYKSMIPVVVNNLNLSHGRKSFYKFFNEIYNELAKEINNNQVNEEILYSVQSKIQSLRQQIKNLPILDRIQTPNKIALPNSLSLNSQKKQQKDYSAQDDYMGFVKPLDKEEESVNNIMKMIEDQKITKETSRKPQFGNKGSLGLNKKNSTKIFLKNQFNPYQMNLYTDEKPQCEFL